ncbi:MAG: hypothetical protein ABGY75_18420 [Gemmataceae bacterium]
MLFAATEITGIVAISVSVGGFVLWGIVHSVVENWRKAKTAEYRAILVQGMVDKGFSPDEVERVLKANDAVQLQRSSKARRLRDSEQAHS